MGKNEDLMLEKNDLIILIILICISLICLIFLSIQNSTKTIYELNNLDSGNYNVSGYASNIVNYNERTSFILSDGNSSIQSVIFSKYYLHSGTKIRGTCQLNIYNNKKNCIFKKVEKEE